MVSTQNNTVSRSKVDITGVPETMLQTLYARAKESRKPDHVIYDGKAIEIVDSLDYDFSLADKDLAMGSGVIARTIVLDKLVSEYLKKHKGAVVVNIASGLDTTWNAAGNCIIPQAPLQKLYLVLLRMGFTEPVMLPWQR